jgi:hypothetical protein
MVIHTIRVALSSVQIVEAVMLENSFAYPDIS